MLLRLDLSNVPANPEPSLERRLSAGVGEDVRQGPRLLRIVRPLERDVGSAQRAADVFRGDALGARADRRHAQPASDACPQPAGAPKWTVRPSSLFWLAWGAAAGCARPTPTFNHDVAPVLFTHCQPCHRPGQPVPFTLMNYADAKRRAAQIADAVEARHMPPWLPARGGPAFAGERGLREADIATIRRWADGGSARRRSVRASAAASLARRLGARPARSRRHHAAPLHADPGASRRLPQRHPARERAGDEVRPRGGVQDRKGRRSTMPSFAWIAAARPPRATGSMASRGSRACRRPTSQDPDGHFIGWAPGRGPIVAPDGLPWSLDASTDLVIELHLLPGKIPSPCGRRWASTSPTRRRPARPS